VYRAENLIDPRQIGIECRSVVDTGTYTESSRTLNCGRYYLSCVRVTSFTGKLESRPFDCRIFISISKRKQIYSNYYSNCPVHPINAIAAPLLRYTRLGVNRKANSRIHSPIHNPYESYSPTARSRSSQFWVDIVHCVVLLGKSLPFRFPANKSAQHKSGDSGGIRENRLSEP